MVRSEREFQSFFFLFTDLVSHQLSQGKSELRQQQQQLSNGGKWRQLYTHREQQLGMRKKRSMEKRIFVFLVFISHLLIAPPFQTCPLVAQKVCWFHSFLCCRHESIGFPRPDLRKFPQFGDDNNNPTSPFKISEP